MGQPYLKWPFDFVLYSWVILSKILFTVQFLKLAFHIEAELEKSCATNTTNFVGFVYQVPVESRHIQGQHSGHSPPKGTDEPSPHRLHPLQMSHR